MKILVNDYQKDQLTEIVNIGASHASTALSQMLHQKVGLTIPNICIDKAENLCEYIKGKNKEVSTATLKVFGDVTGLMYFVFSHENEEKIVDLLIGEVENEQEREELKVSVLKEVGNILAGSTLSAFSNFLDITLLHNIAKIINDKMHNVAENMKLKLGGKNGIVLVFQLDFSVKSEEIRTQFLFFVDEAAAQKLLHLLNFKYQK